MHLSTPAPSTFPLHLRPRHKYAVVEVLQARFGSYASGLESLNHVYSFSKSKSSCRNLALSQKRRHSHRLPAQHPPHQPGDHDAQAHPPQRRGQATDDAQDIADHAEEELQARP